MAGLRHLGAFPFCVPPDPSLIDPDSGYWRFGTTLVKAMEWFWRVKKWTVGGEWTHDEGSGSFEFEAQAEYYDGSAYVTPSSERDLVCYQQGQIRIPAPSGASYTADIRIFDGNQAGYWAVENSGLIYPGVDCSFSAPQGTGTASLDTSSSGDGEFQLDGIPSPALACALGSGTLSASLLVVPTEWWPYDPGDGLGPIYDSTDGSQLRSLPL